MKIINRDIGIELEVKKLEVVINFLGIPTKMKQCGISVIDNDTMWKEHINNCLDRKIVYDYLVRFMNCKTKEEAEYIKKLARKGLVENQEVIIDGKESKILHFNDSTSTYPMFVNKTSKGVWSKQRKLLYGNCVVTGYKDFNNKDD